MFNEYEDDDDDGEIFQLMAFDTDLLADIAAAANAATSSTGIYLNQDIVDATIEMLKDALNYNSRYIKDQVIASIDNSTGNSYDINGFLKDEFKVKLVSIAEVEGGAGAEVFSPETFVPGNIGIYADTIEDTVAAGGEIASGEYVLYSALSKTGQYQPPINLVFDQSKTKLSDGNSNPYYSPMDFNDDTTWGFTVRTRVEYGSTEKSALSLKYGTIAGTTGVTADSQAQEYLNSQFDEAALDVYNTVITREYVPKLLKQERGTMSAVLNASIGDEQDPLASTIFNTTTTYNEEI